MLVTCEVQVGHTDSTGTDDSSGKLVAWGDDALAGTHRSEDFPRKDGAESYTCSGFFKETPSGFTHSAIIYDLFVSKTFVPKKQM